MSAEEKLKQAFQASDTNGDGKLCFDEFFALLKTGDDAFPEDEAQTLFKAADKDGSGEVEFNEFVDYIFDNKDFGEFIESRPSETDATEEDEAKKIVLAKSVQVRTATSKAVKADGGDWAKMTWKERLVAVKVQEEGGAILPHSKTGKVCFDDSADKNDSSSQMRKAKTSPALGESDDKVEDSQDGRKSMSVMSMAGTKSVTSTQSAIAEKTQEELVEYSIHKYDLNFAGRDPEATQTLLRFKEYLKSVGGPEEIVNIKKYLAKGTAGWVFAVEDKTSGTKYAMKLIRMTQALSGVKEWYVSKVLRQAGVKNIVFTDEKVRVLSRAEAPPIVENELRDAGPVPFYFAALQDFMGYGSLEDLQEKDKLPPKMMFKGLEDVATTLGLMHDMSIHHKDVKPENVLVEMDGDNLVAAKLCDFGSAEFGNNTAGRADDTRRFGVTLFSLATGEGWTKNRLIREKHDALVQRMGKAVGSHKLEAMRALPNVLSQILGGTMKMQQVAELMAELKEAC